MKRFFLLITYFLLLLFAASAQTGIYSTRTGKVDFLSDAPLELIKASSEKLHGVLDTDKRTFAFSIPSDSFKGFNSPLQQEHFYENYMEAKIYPTSTFSGKIIEQIDFSTDGTYTIRAKGKLLIHGVEQERIIKVNLKILKGQITAESNFSIMLEDHNFTIPRVVFQKIAEEIKVTVHAVFEKKK